MSMETCETTMNQLSTFQDIEISEKQLEGGKIKGAKTALIEMREKYSRAEKRNKI